MTWPCTCASFFVFTVGCACHLQGKLQPRPGRAHVPPLLCSQLDAPVVSKAFLNHDLATLKLHCAPELVERFSGIFRHFSEQVRAVGSTALLQGHGLPWQLRVGVACEAGLNVALCCCSFNDAEALAAGGGASCFNTLC